MTKKPIRYSRDDNTLGYVLLELGKPSTMTDHAINELASVLNGERTVWNDVNIIQYTEHVRSWIAGIDELTLDDMLRDRLLRSMKTAAFKTISLTDVLKP